MSARKKTITLLLIIGFSFLSPLAAANTTLTQDAIARQLGWVWDPNTKCGGYYLEQPLVYPVEVERNNVVAITSDQTLFAQHSTSLLEGNVSVTRRGQQITANKAYLYRDANGKLSSVKVLGDVRVREPNTLIVGDTGVYTFTSKAKKFLDILYRTLLNGRQIVGSGHVSDEEMEQERKLTTLTAWGQAHEFSQVEPKVYELDHGSFSTCPPINPAWKVKASYIQLNKNTGRGYATHARILIKDVPVFYLPYINFSIDRQRKSGFLWPTPGISNSWGPSVLLPFYWNMAPNYDMTITPGLLMKRGLLVTDNYRYLTPTSDGRVEFSVLPGDSAFSTLQTTTKTEFQTNTNPVIQSELNRLLNSSTTRRGFLWRNRSQYNDHWSSNVDFNYAGDDYFMQDFGSDLNEILQNQLLEEGDLFYKGQNWNFTGRLQAYQTLHPLVENLPATLNQYRRFPQLILNADYPDQPFGLEYFINNEVTHFSILNTPGNPATQPVGYRAHMQPGVSMPINFPYFFINPRFQVAFTDYQLYQNAEAQIPNNEHRAIPIFDVATGLSFNREAALFHHQFQQTLEPQVYYTYIPYRNQSSIPVFDTTLNTLTYDQIFNYNRFSGIDRFGDANQVGIGVTSRLIDQESGFEKARLGVGEIVYFADRRVNLCTNKTCTDFPDNPSDHQMLSPLSAVLNYNVSPFWSFAGYGIWNPITQQLDNTILALHYQLDDQRIFNLGYNFAHNGDILAGLDTNSSANNLKLTDASVVWPVWREVSTMVRWSEDWNMNRLQTFFVGLQYDTCCWSMRLVGGKTFIGLDTTNNNKFQYSNLFFLQFALKGLGNVGYHDASSLLTTNIPGYKTQFGQDI